eukprot:TRINITY_DN11696_c0_g1_i5.p1 TRINITY_DN11696_c0_g1~~TRINITY_DN11696_c0_g1_i5.p1  ORF type:complete len:206 (+),score=31.29 TRINITY_DN11696_c0_g1_i5:707-1324(+)
MTLIRTFMFQICSQVEALHECKVVHNTLTPDSIVMVGKDKVALTNFSRAVVTARSAKVRNLNLLVPPSFKKEVPNAWGAPDVSYNSLISIYLGQSQRSSKASSDADDSFQDLEDLEQLIPVPNPSCDVYQLGLLLKFLLNEAAPGSNYGSVKEHERRIELRKRYRVKTMKQSVMTITNSIKLAKDELEHMEVDETPQKEHRYPIP